MENEVIEFSKCLCGSEDTFVKRLRARVAEKGLHLNGYPEYLTSIPAVMVRKGGPVIIGQKTPAGQVELDVCMTCGMLRAVKVVISEAVSMPAPTQPPQFPRTGNPR
jgi:hypothetical protein